MEGVDGDGVYEMEAAKGREREKEAEVRKDRRDERVGMGNETAERRGKSRRRSGGRCMVIGEQWRRMK